MMAAALALVARDPAVALAARMASSRWVPIFVRLLLGGKPGRC